MRFVLVVMCLLLWSTAAYAQPEVLEESQAPSDRPWAQDVSPEDQATAERLFTEGTELLKDALFLQAVALYRQALTHWDHPAIHFNLAKALMNLDDPAAAYTHFKASMRFGGKPLDADQLEQVERTSQMLYETRLAELVVICDEPGARVRMDGVDLFVGPGRWQGVVQPEKTKTILATKVGFQTQQIDPELVKGQVNEIKITLARLDTSVMYETEFDTWIPWAVIGGGVVLLAGGGILTWQSLEANDAYDAGVAECTSATPPVITDDDGTVVSNLGGSVGSCVPSASVMEKKDQGSLFQTLSTAAYIAGGATVVTGIVLLLINRERPINVDKPVEEDAPVDTTLSITPFVGPERAGVSATFGF